MSKYSGLFPSQRGQAMPTRAERQREWREWQRRNGYKRLDIWISPKLWVKLKSHLDPRYRDSHPGASLVDFLESLEITPPE